MIYLLFRLILKLFLSCWRFIFGWLDSEPKTFNDWKERGIEEDLLNPSIVSWSISKGPPDIDVAIEALKNNSPDHKILVERAISLCMSTKFLSEYYPQARMDEGKYYQGSIKPKYITKTSIDHFHSLLRSKFKENCNTALCLSGGGGLGIYHVGVVMELEERSLLPMIISGSSVGSFIAAMASIHPVNDWTSKMSLFKTLKLLSSSLTKKERGEKLYKIVKEAIGDWTFLEIYKERHKILLIPVTKSSSNAVEGTTIHYFSHPNTFIWSAVLASCSIPPLFPAVPLYYKEEFGGVSSSTTLWMDGSIHQDIPISSEIRETFNINHTIISQVNPHIYPFLRWVIDVDGRRSIFSRIIAPLLKKEILLRLDQLSPLHPLLPFLRRIIKQRYYGDVTILVKIPITRFMFFIQEPTIEFIKEAIQEGRRATWPKIHLLQNRMGIDCK